MNDKPLFAVLLSVILLSGTALAQDTSAPQISQQQPAGNNVEINGPAIFSGSITDIGGAGLERAFYVLRNLVTNEWVDTRGNVDGVRVFRDTELTLSDANSGIWQLQTSLPEGRYRLYVSARDNARNTLYWGVRTTITSIGGDVGNGDETDESLPLASLTLPESLQVTEQRFAGTATDTGGSGLRDLFYLIRNTASGDFVSPSGNSENPRVIRQVSLSLSDADNGTWQFDTSLPAGQYRFYIGVSDIANNTNYWIVRETFDIIDDTGPVDPGTEPEPEPIPEPDSSVFIASSSDITDTFDFYQRDGYETIDVIRMDVATRTSPGTCEPGDESGCTLADVLADTNGDDDFKVDIDVKLRTDDLIETGADVNAGLRQRGASARLAPQKSFRVRLEDDLWRGEERIQLNKHPYDQSRMSNKLAFDLMQRLPHLPSLRTQFVNLWIDDGAGPVDQGLYTHVESRAKEYLINRGLDKDDNVYKANFFTFSTSDLAAIQVDANGEPLDEARFEERIEIDRGDDHSKLVEMVAAINNPNIDFEAVLERYFNRNNVLMWVTANLLLGQKDVIDQNFFLYNPMGSEKFYFLPWDYDGALRVEPPLSDSNEQDELRRRLIFGFANAANNQFLRQYYLLPGAHDRIVRAAEEVRRKFLTDELIRDLSGQYATAIRPFISRSPDIENIGGVRRLEQLNVWENRWQSFPSIVASNLVRLKASPNMPLPHRLKQPFSRNGNTVLWWERATDITGGSISYVLAISSRPDFADGSVIFSDSGITNQPERVEYVLDRLSLPAGTWYYRVRANAGNFYQVANNVETVAGERFAGIRRFVVE